MVRSGPSSAPAAVQKVRQPATCAVNAFESWYCSRCMVQLADARPYHSGNDYTADVRSSARRWGGLYFGVFIQLSFEGLCMAQKNENGKSERVNVGRRAFLKTAGVAPLAAGVIGGVAELEAQTSRVVGPGEVSIQLIVNGKRLNLNVEPRVTLLNAIRNKADITGNKRGCDRGVCGACTMIID